MSPYVKVMFTLRVNGASQTQESMAALAAACLRPGMPWAGVYESRARPDEIDLVVYVKLAEEGAIRDQLAACEAAFLGCVREAGLR